MDAAGKSLVGKVALVVGSSGGIGSAVATSLAEAGARICTADRVVEASACGLLQGRSCQAYGVDITDSAQLVTLGNRIESDYGRLDILVNAAGFTRSVSDSDLEGLTDDLIDEMFRVNWRAQFAIIRSMTPLLKASGNGLIVSVSSIAAVTGIGSNIAYCAVKAGIDVMTKALARSLAPEIRVLAVSPGMVDTDFVPGRDADFNKRVVASIPLGTIATPQDVADAILACATHLRYSTGCTVRVDGGRSL